MLGVRNTTDALDAVEEDQGEEQKPGVASKGLDALRHQAMQRTQAGVRACRTLYEG